ncbi:exodeoxyribonuclease V subunit gamma [Paractinoplanes lichenicola]|uniref:RecBCD enzyme subunit RecC n=1 Tax=Paractinoplanes lichenicola TaxID=2802976 RepID=A0ABS1VM50_9ACTN|nr:exodeoxyribonuclease V subunit gamma [Actinoplanes lichenicola]MBL7255802.1 exodeoxyribonuclease V subunit gamma [Actinoplanes lichenicola]
MLLVHRAERTDRLADALADVVCEPLGDPFAPEIVSVPSKGVERWLAQRLSHRLGVSTGDDGVCANVQFPSLADLLGQVGLPGDDPWRPDRLVWPLLEVIDRSVSERWCRPLAAYLGALEDDPIRRGRRYATARHLAELFDSYGRHRPAMLRAWSAGQDSGVPGDLTWQAELWRRLISRMPVPSPAERLPGVCAALRRDPGSSPLPGRLSVFGLTRLPAAHAALLDALAAGRDVHLWLPHPSPALWESLTPYGQSQLPLAREADPTRELPRHPLLASLGRDARELQLLLAPAEDRHHPGPAFPPTLLGHLQRAIAADSLTNAQQVIDESDRSVQVHACHGHDRQVEVLREIILGLLSADPTLEPRDILVMCPDIESFAPLISASFGLGAEAAHPAHKLRVRLADRALRQLNPLFGVIAHLLELADARVTAAQVLDLAATAPVRRRFRFDDDDLDRLRELVVESGVRWGFDSEHRQRFQVTARSNTWAAGLDRILLGAAMSEEEPNWLGTALPLDDMDSSDVDLAGRLAELVDRLGAILTGFSGERSLDEWLRAIAAAVDEFTAVSDADAWQRIQLDAELAEIGDSAAPLCLADVRSLLGGRLRGSPTRANFRTGDLTMCTMVPMRSVPHRVICVLGLDDGVFPRGAGLDGDDVLGRVPYVGERDPRGEDRQLLLDAVMAATDALVLVYSGADERTNAPRPPSVPLDEVLDALDRTGRTRDGRSMREFVLTRHPLQPFDARNFRADTPFSFDPTALAGAVAAAGERTDQPPFLSAPLPPPVADVVELSDLHAFFAHPVRAFLRRRLGVGLFGDDGEPADGLPVELDNLEKWSVGDRLLRSLLDGTDLNRCVQAEWRRGTVPPGPLGSRLLDAIAGEAMPLATAAKTHVDGVPEAVDITVALPDGRLLVGTVGDVYGDTVAAVNYSRVSPKHRLKAWLQLLALTAGRPDVPWRSVTIGRGFGGPSRSSFGPIDAGIARRLLGDLVALADEGLCEPVPLATKTSHAYAKCRLSGGPAETAYGKARQEWAKFDGGGENEDAEHRLVWGPDAAFDRLLSDPARFDTLAMRVWEPLCRAETSEQL